MARLIKIILFLVLSAIIADLFIYIYRIDQQPAPHKNINPHSVYTGH